MDSNPLLTSPIPGGTSADNAVWSDEVGTVHRILLANKNLTTVLLEQLAGATIVTESRNFVRDSRVFRLAVLIGNGRILVFARSMLNLALLPRQARFLLLEGKVPLGRILQKHRVKTDRRNFSRFVLEDVNQIPVLFNSLVPVSPTFRQWLADRHIPAPGSPDRAGSGIFHRPCLQTAAGCRKEKYVGRTYDIFLQERRLAAIEEIFLPGSNCWVRAAEPANS